MPDAHASLQWSWQSLNSLESAQLLQIMIERQRVFVVEQRCAYQDADDLDRTAWHLLGHDKRAGLVAYARVNPPGTRFAQASFGRVMTVTSVRRRGLGDALVERCIGQCRSHYPEAPILISAQTYLIPWYRGFGFESRGAAYDEDGIEHIDMELVHDR